MSGTYEFNINMLAEKERVNADDLRILLANTSMNAVDYESELEKLRVKKAKKDTINAQISDLAKSYSLVSKSILNYINNSLFYLSYEFLRSFN